MTEQALSIGVIGGGAWGTALAQSLAASNHNVRLYAREHDVVEGINSHHINCAFLPNIKLQPTLEAREGFDGLNDHDVLLLVAPAQYVRSTCRAIKAKLTKTIPLVLCAKGIEIETGQLMHEIAAAELPGLPLAVLSGPTFAAEVAKGLPAAISIASNDEKLARNLCLKLGSRSLRPYPSTDMAGVEIGGAVKNVLAIACGIVVGRGLGENARAAMIARGLAEMMRLAVAVGGRPETITGLSGLGDLVLTCSSPQSRNMSLGLALGQGRKLQDVLAERHTVAEGVATARAVQRLADKHNVDMPICHAAYAILHDGKDVNATIEAMLARPLAMGE